MVKYFSGNELGFKNVATMGNYYTFTIFCFTSGLREKSYWYIEAFVYLIIWCLVRYFGRYILSLTNHLYGCVFMCIYVYVCVFMYVSVYLCVCVRADIFVYVCTYLWSIFVYVCVSDCYV